MGGSRILPGTEEAPDVIGVYRAKVEVKGVKNCRKVNFLSKRMG